MSIPNNEPFFIDEDPDSPPQPSMRRRKRRRGGLPIYASDRAEFVKDLAVEVTPSINFFIYSIISGLVLGLAILFDAPVLYFLAALVAPLMTPVVGLSLAVLFGSGRFFLKEAGSLLVGAVLIFLCGMLTGWITSMFPPVSQVNISLHNSFNWVDISALTLGVILVNILIVRSPHSHLMGLSALLAYELYLPVGISGFGLVTGTPDLFANGLIVFVVHLAWAVLVGTFILAIVGLRPKTIIGYTVGTSLLLLAIVTVVMISGLGTALTERLIIPLNIPLISSYTPTSTSLPSSTPLPVLKKNTPIPTKSVTKPAAKITNSITPTNTLIPSRTPTTTYTILPTPVYARIHVEGFTGAFIRAKPDQKSNIQIALLNGSLIQLLPEDVIIGNIHWVHVRSADGLVEGWMMRNLLTLTTTTTPPPPP